MGDYMLRLGKFGCLFGLGLTKYKHMLTSQDMLMTYQKNHGTYRRMLIGQDMLIANMLISRFYCIYYYSITPYSKTSI